MQNTLLKMLLLLTVFSGLVNAQDNLTTKSGQGNVALSQSRLPYSEPIDTIKLKDETKVDIYSNSLRDDVSATSTIYYLPIPKVIIEQGKYYDSQNGLLRFKVAVPVVNDSIREQFRYDEWKKATMVQLPIRGYEITVTIGNVSEVIKSSRGAVNQQIQILGNISCTYFIQNPEIKQALENYPEDVNIVINFICKFKEAVGSRIRIESQNSFRRQLDESVLNTLEEALCSRQTIANYVRNIHQDITMELNQSGEIEFVGSQNDADWYKWVDFIVKQNSSLFEEKKLSEFDKIAKPLVFYSPDFVRYEFQPAYVDSLVKSKEVNKEVKQHFLNEWNHYKEIANKSENVEDFKKNVNTDASYKGNFSLNIFDVIKIGSDDTDTRFKRDNNSSNYKRNWEDLYSLLKDKNFNESDCFDKFYEKLDGDMKEFYTNPKDYRVIVFTHSKIKQMWQFYLQNSTLDNITGKLKFETTIKDALENIQTNKRIEELEAEVKKLKAKVDDDAKTIQDLIDLLKKR